MEKWLTAYKIPVGQWGKQFFDFLTTWLDWFFDGLSTGISAVLEAMIAALLWPPPLVIVRDLHGARLAAAPLHRDHRRRRASGCSTS